MNLFVQIAVVSACGAIILTSVAVLYALQTAKEMLEDGLLKLDATLDEKQAKLAAVAAAVKDLMA